MDLFHSLFSLLFQTVIYNKQDFTDPIHVPSWRKMSQLEGYQFREVSYWWCTFWHWVVSSNLLGEQLHWYVAIISITLLVYRIFCVFCYCSKTAFSPSIGKPRLFFFLNCIKSQRSKLVLHITKFQLSHWKCLFLPLLPWWLGQCKYCGNGQKHEFWLISKYGTILH